MIIHTHCFSGTGTTRHTIRLFGDELSERIAAPVKHSEFTLPEERLHPPALAPDDILVVGVPVIAGRVPNLLLPYLNTLHGEGQWAIPLVLYGNRAFEDALAELGDLLTAKGFRLLSGAAFIGQHAFARNLAAGRPDDADDIAVRRWADAVAEKHRAGIFSPLALPGNHPAGPYYIPRDAQGEPINILKVKPKTNERCNRCGWCATHCPLAAIPVDAPELTTGKCMKCSACVVGCPQKARYYDDPGLLYHAEDLEHLYGGRRCEPQWFI